MVQTGIDQMKHGYQLVDTETGKVMAIERYDSEEAEKHNHAYKIGARISGGKPLRLEKISK